MASPDRNPEERASNDTSLATLIDALEKDIIFGRLRPRERLIEDDLIARFGAKRHVVRAALVELERMGIVTRRKNRGAIVRDLSPDEVDQIFQVREFLHRAAVERMALPAPADLVNRLEDIHRRHSAAVDAGDLPTVYALNNDFHDTFFGASESPYLLEAVNHFAWLAHNIRSYRMADPVLLNQARREHGEMIDAMREGDRDALIRLCVDHIQPSRQAYLRSQSLMGG